LGRHSASTVIASHSRSKNGVASRAYGEAIQPRAGRRAKEILKLPRRCVFAGALRARWIASSLRFSQ
jgi:hypothetical protein